MTAQVYRYFAYGSNMDPARVAERGLSFDHVEGARLRGCRLQFDKQSRDHLGIGHANIVWDPTGTVEGVLYRLSGPDEILRMDRFERAPVNYSRDVVIVESAAGPVAAWTYFANPAVRVPGLLPERAYLDHMLASALLLSDRYLERLSNWPCVELRGAGAPR